MNTNTTPAENTTPAANTTSAVNATPAVDTTPADGTPSAADEPGFTIVRDFAANRDRVWDAWTNPVVMAQWMHPETLVTPRESVSVDLRVGGLYTYTMQIVGTEMEFPTAGRYLHVEPPRRLDFTWGSPGDVDDAPRVSIEFEEIDENSTRMTFALTGIPNDSGSDASAYDGWSSAFNVLEGELAV